MVLVGFLVGLSVRSSAHGSTCECYSVGFGKDVWRSIHHDLIGKEAKLPAFPARLHTTPRDLFLSIVGSGQLLFPFQYVRDSVRAFQRCYLDAAWRSLQCGLGFIPRSSCDRVYHSQFAIASIRAQFANRRDEYGRARRPLCRQLKLSKHPRPLRRPRRRRAETRAAISMSTPMNLSSSSTVSALL